MMNPEQTKQFRIALVGCGAIAPIHIAAILSSGNEICALCDKEPKKARALKERFGLDRAEIFSDYESMLSESGADAVHICTPHYLHVPMTVAALKRNLHVLCEKPLAISEEQIREVLQAEKESRSTLGVCLQNRYSSRFANLKKLADSIGVEAAFGDVVWKRNEDYYRSGDWRGKKATEGGGVMMNQALHTLDLLQWICGMPKTVTAHCCNDHLREIIEVEDTAIGRFQTENGFFQIYATTGAASDFSAHVRVKLKDGTVVHAENFLWDVNGKTPQADREQVCGKEVWGDGHKALIADFYDCIGHGKRFPIDAREGSLVVRLVLGMYQSNGNEISIPEN